MKVSIIAEIGSNWEGSMKKAEKIIKECKNDPFDEALFTKEARVIGQTQYIYIANKNKVSESLGPIEEEDSDDEKIPNAD